MFCLFRPSGRCEHLSSPIGDSKIKCYIKSFQEELKEFKRETHLIVFTIKPNFLLKGCFSNPRLKRLLFKKYIVCVNIKWSVQIHSTMNVIQGRT